MHRYIGLALTLGQKTKNYENLWKNMRKNPLPLAQEEDHLAHLQKYLRNTQWSYDRCRDSSYSNILWNAGNAYYVDRLRHLLQSLGFQSSTDLLHTFTKKSKQFRLLHDPTLSTDQWTYTLQFICFHCCTDPNDPTKIIKGKPFLKRTHLLKSARIFKVDLKYQIPVR